MATGCDVGCIPYISSLIAHRHIPTFHLNVVILSFRLLNVPAIQSLSLLWATKWNKRYVVMYGMYWQNETLVKGEQHFKRNAFYVKCWGLKLGHTTITAKRNSL